MVIFASSFAAPFAIMIIRTTDNLYYWTLKLFDEVHDIKSTPEEQPELEEEQPEPAEETRTETKSG
ncbi:hypothetical protein BBO_07127 [Beauveria brongniartii RCEF 3172]|uniref:Uncharacterized protein n=1 Tax=Beauveria brongniartii RCEF 3172 TaxID=1081107 RepID=A0A167A2P9_9HYPO|nr:hypothetical protein BBO_07127 [Beauveria brongniartii RCEF 3172]